MRRYFHDPGGVFWRRSLRVAVVLPPLYYFVYSVLGDQPGAGLAAFTVYALLALADFGGPPASRARAYLVTGAVGAPMIVVGSLLANFVVLSIVAAGLVAFFVSFAGVLRGYVAAASTPLLLPFVLALTTAPSVSTTMSMLIGYAIAVVVAVLAALLLWPSYLRSSLRSATAAAVQAAGDEVQVRWLGRRTGAAVSRARERTEEALAAVHASFDGALVRPGPATARDRSLVAVISELDRLDRVLSWQDRDPGVKHEFERNLAGAVVEALDRSAQALNGHSHPPDPGPVNRAREDHQIALETLVAADMKQGSHRPDKVADQLAHLMNLRIVALSAQSIAGNCSGAVGEPVRAGSAAVTLGGQLLWDPTDRPGPRFYLASQWRWSSPWLRNALRTGVAITVATAIVQLAHVQHGLWIVLGTLVALRFDAAGTSRTAASVIIGTVVGFAAGVLMIFTIGGHPLVLWAVLPILVFLASYTPNSVSLTVGQALFAVYGIAIYALYTPGYSTAEFRLFNVVVAMGVSLLVSALLWPRGVVAIVETTMRTAAATTGSGLRSAVATLTGAPGHLQGSDMDRQLIGLRQEMTLAAQTYDLAYAQKGPGLPDIRRWAIWAGAVSDVERTTEIVASMIKHGRTHGGDRATREALVDSAERLAQTLARGLTPSQPVPVPQPLPSSARWSDAGGALWSTVRDYTTSQLRDSRGADPRDITAIVWLCVWLEFASWEVEQAVAAG